MSKRGPKKGAENAGRPPTEIDWGVFENLCGLQCTITEIAGWFNCDPATIENRVKAEYGETFSNIFRQKRGSGKISLRRKQWKIADKNAAMAIFLGKNYLNQKDIPDYDQTDNEVANSINAKDISSIFTKNYNSVNDETNITINRGGTASTKTVSLGQLAMEFLLTGQIGDKVGRSFDIVSKTLPALKSTAIRDFLNFSNIYGYDLMFEHKKSAKEFWYKDRVVRYYSIDDEKKVRGQRRDFLWISEADTISYEIFRQLQMRTLRHTFMDFNPDNEFIWINEEIEQKRAKEQGDVFVIQSSYLDNPFLDDKNLLEINVLRTDPEYWQIYGLGNYGSIAGLIYKNWEEYEVLPEKKFITFYGQDYGFSNSRDAMLKIRWEMGTKNLYMDECYYELGMSTAGLIEKTKESNPDNDPVYGDCAEARLMHEIRSSGVQLYKPKKAVLSSINLLKSFNLFIYSGSSNLLMEIKRYKWMKKDGKRINQPLKAFDHLMNAGQYGITGFMSMYGNKYKILKEVLTKKNVKV